MIPLPLALFVAVASLLFAWEAYRWIMHGITRFPVQVLGIEEFERDHTMFWGIVGANVLTALGLFGGAVTIVVKNWS